MFNQVLIDKLARIFYHLPTPPPRVRTKPMKAFCVGFL
jgi:hypothetical protein